MELDEAAARESVGYPNEYAEKNSGSEENGQNEERRHQTAIGAGRYLRRDKEETGELEVQVR